MTDPRTSEGRAELRALLDHAHFDRLRVGDGPFNWRTLLSGDNPGLGIVHLVNMTPAMHSAKAKAIVAAVNALPVLLDEIDRLREVENECVMRRSAMKEMTGGAECNRSHWELKA